MEATTVVGKFKVHVVVKLAKGKSSNVWEELRQVLGLKEGNHVVNSNQVDSE